MTEASATGCALATAKLQAASNEKNKRFI